MLFTASYVCGILAYVVRKILTPSLVARFHVVRIQSDGVPESPLFWQGVKSASGLAEATP